MLLISAKCVHYVLIILVLQTSIITIESLFSPRTTKIQRSQSMRASSHLTRTQSTLPRIAESESESRPIASTSAIQPDINNVNLHKQDTDLQPLIEESKHVRIVDSPILLDPMAMTQSEHINPARDGVFARTFRYGASAAIGSAVGIGVKHFLSQNDNKNNITQPMNQTDSNDIINPL